MKKFSMILVIFAILATALIGATAFATTYVETEENIFVGEYAHDNWNNTDKDVVIVFGTASTEAENITERGVVLSDGTDYYYFRTRRYDEATGKFGVAIIRKDIPKAAYTAKAYVKIGGEWDPVDNIIKNYTNIYAGEAVVELDFTTAISTTQDEITVTSAQPVDLKDYITVADGTTDLLEYSVSAQNGEIEVSKDGIVTFGNKAGKYTVTATHKFSTESVTISVIAYDEVYEVTQASQLVSLADEHANSYVKLMTDVAVGTTDMVVETSPAKNNEDSAYVIGGTFNGIFDGQTNKITYNFDCTEKDYIFRGLFRQVTGTVKNLQLEATANQKNDYGYYFADSMGSKSLIENCYVDVTLKQQASKSGNNTTTHFVIGSSSGRIENIVFNMRGNLKDETTNLRGVGLQEYGTGIWTNIVVCSDYVAPWRGGMFQAKMAASQLNNVVFYKSMAYFWANRGRLIGVASDYTFTDITTEQTIGSAWTIDRTEFSESIKLNGKDMWKSVVTEVTDEEDFISKMNSATEQTVLKLTQDLTFNTSHFTRENNGGTGAQSVNVYMVKSFKGTLFGNGKEISWELIPEDCADKGNAASYVKGLIFTVEKTSKIVGCNFYGITHIPYDFSTGFIEDVHGIIEDCFISTDICMIGANNGAAATGIIGTNAGLIKNCIVKGDVYRAATNTGAVNKGAKIIHNGAKENTGTFEGVALIQSIKNIGTTNNANSGYISDAMLVDLVYYASLSDLVSATGERVHNADDTTSTFEYEALTEPQNLGSAWTIDATGIKLNDEYVWKDTVVTTDVEELTLFPGSNGTATITASINGVESTAVTFVSDNTSVVTVDASGLVTAVTTGTANIFVYDEYRHFAKVSVQVASARAISSEEEFLAIGELDADTYAYLTTDITLTQEDAITITSGSTTYGSFVQELKATLDGNGHKITFAYASPVNTTRFGGLFYIVSGKIMNLVIDADISAVPNYSYVVSAEFKKTGILENSFIESKVALGTATTDSRVAIIGSHYGAVKNTIISSIVTKSSSTYGMALQLYATSTPRGTWTNVALACPKTTASYTNRGGSKKITGADLNNVVRYTSLDNVIAGVGNLYSTTKDDSGAWTQTELNTAITEAQNLGSAWTIVTAKDATTENPAGIKLNGEYVYTVA